MNTDQKRILVPIAEGFEEIEALAPIDIFRRAGYEVVMAGVDGITRCGSHGIEVNCDTEIEKVSIDFDAMVLPGGALGAKNLASSWAVNEKMLLILNNGGVIAAICASPAVVLGPSGVLQGRKAVCYPSTETYAPTVNFVDERVCIDGPIITAKAAGCSIEFALAIVEKLSGVELANTIADAMFVSR